MKVSLRSYFAGFVSIYGGLAAIPFVSALLGVVFKDSGKWAEALYPPLGDVQNLAEVVSAGVLIATPFLVYLSLRLSRRISAAVPALLIAVVIVCFVALMGLYGFFVRRVSVPSIDAKVWVSVGYTKTELARQFYRGLSDWEMLHDRGPYEDQIQILWTPGSVYIVRALLWLCYTVSLACFAAIWCLGAYQQASESEI
jgi:hypothetical protein